MNRMNRCLIGFGLASLAAIGLAAGSAQPKDERNDPRSWLERQVGSWESKSELAFDADPESPRTKSSGQNKSRMLGSWLITEGVMQVEGVSVSFLRTLGFDEQKKRFVGSWIDTATSHLWTFEGAMDGDALELGASGESCLEPGKITQYRESYKFTPDGSIQHRSKALHSSGKWVEYMSTVYRRD